MRQPYSVFSRNGIWYTRLWDEQRQRYCETLSTGQRNKTVAIRIAKERLATRDCGVISRNTTLCEYAEQYWDLEKSDYFKMKKWKSSSPINPDYLRYNYNYIIKHAKPYFKKTLIKDVKTRDIDNYLFYLLSKHKNYSPNTLNKIIYAVTKPIKYAYEHGDLAPNPSIGNLTSRLSQPGKKRGCFFEEEIKALLNLEWEDHKYKTIFKLAALCGMRLGEIKALKIKNVYEKHLTVCHSWSNSMGIKCTKNGKERIVPLVDNLSEDLYKLGKTCSPMDDLLFHGRDRMKPLSSRAIEQALYSAMELIGISKEERIQRNLVFHSLRHFANSNLLQWMGSENVRLIMGHSSQAMTEHYSHMLENTLKLGRQAQLQLTKSQSA